MADAPASPFPAGDPRSATYNDQLASLLHQQESALAGDEARRTEARASSKYGISQLNMAEPRALTSEQNTANSQGLAESGINAQRRGALQSGYVSKRGQIASKLQTTEGTINRSEQQARESYGLGVKSAADKAVEQYRAELLAANPTTPEAQASNLGPNGGVRQYSREPAGAGGVKGYTEANPNGTFVRVRSNAPSVASVRQQAAKKALAPPRRR